MSHILNYGGSRQELGYKTFQGEVESKDGNGLSVYLKITDKLRLQIQDLPGEKATIFFNFWEIV